MPDIAEDSSIYLDLIKALIVDTTVNTLSVMHAREKQTQSMQIDGMDSTEYFQSQRILAPKNNIIYTHPDFNSRNNLYTSWISSQP